MSRYIYVSAAFVICIPSLLEPTENRSTAFPLVANDSTHDVLRVK